MRIWGSQANLDLLLINSPLSDYSLSHPKYTVFQPPIGLASLASYLDKKGFWVGVWDADADKISPEEIARDVATLKPRWVGFNTFTSGFEILKETVCRIGEISPETRIMLGGAHATTSGEDYLLLKGFEEAVVVGHDGELKAEAILGGRNLREIPGISFIGTEGIVTNPERKNWLLQDLDHSVLGLDRKFVPYDPTLGFISPDGKRRAFVASSRDCPYECTYCASSRLLRGGIGRARYRKPEGVVRELVEIIQSGVLDIKFNDELAWASEGRIRDILGLLKEAGYDQEMGLELRGNGRANIIASASDETLDLMRDVGVRKVGIGVEQGTEKGMGRVKKGIIPEQVIIATRRLAERGIPVLANFMFGLPGEDENETKATVALARELVLVGRRCGINIELDGYKYRPYPGTELWEQLTLEGYTPADLKRVIQVEAETGAGSHLQVEPFLNLADIDSEVEQKHRRILDRLTEMSDGELGQLEKEYPPSLCFEGQSPRGSERRHL